MKTFKLSLSVLGKYVICLLMCFFVTFSFIAVFSMFSLDMIGYDAAIFENEEASEPLEEYKHYYADGEDTKKAEAESKNQIVVTREFASEFSGTPYVACHIIAQAVSLTLFIAIMSSSLNKQGRADLNAVHCGRAKEDILKGLKVGLVPTGVSIASWVCLVLAKSGIFKAGLPIYSFANYHFFGYQKLIFGNNVAVEALSTGTLFLALLPAVITLAVCTVAYILGYKDISLYEKAVYKK